MDSKLFGECLSKFIETTKSRLDVIKGTPSPTFFSIVLDCDTLAGINIDDFYDSLTLGKPSPVLYYYKIISNHSPSEIKGFVRNYKDTYKKPNDDYLALPKVNDLRLNEILYVGKSQKDFKSRLKNHFGLGSVTTYALHLSKWNTKLLVPKGLKLELYYTQIPNVTDSDLVELLESSLHHTLQPILGRSGH